MRLLYHIFRRLARGIADFCGRTQILRAVGLMAAIIAHWLLKIRQTDLPIAVSIHSFFPPCASFLSGSRCFPCIYYTTNRRKCPVVQYFWGWSGDIIYAKIQLPILTLWAVVLSDDRESQLVHIKILGGFIVRYNNCNMMYF